MNRELRLLPRLKPVQYSRRNFLRTSALSAGSVLFFGCVPRQNEALIKILHLPEQFSRRAGDISANVSGYTTTELKQLRYRVNNKSWIISKPKAPRVFSSQFVLEISAADLQAGANTLTIEATPKRGAVETMLLSFGYQPSPILLPFRTDWSALEDAQLDVQDGHWETIQVDGQWRVRPKPGDEGYDRILNVTGAIPGGRRVETELTLRSHEEGEKYGFGILPMWGGHPDEVGVSPRRGWRFGIAWFYSHYNGIGAEFSNKIGKADADWISSYRNFEAQANVPYQVIAECFPEVNQAGQHLRYRQRVKWFAAGESEPDSWIEVLDTEGAPLPAGEYAIALVAHRSQVEFGAVSVTAIDAVVSEA